MFRQVAAVAPNNVVGAVSQSIREAEDYAENKDKPTWILWSVLKTKSRVDVTTKTHSQTDVDLEQAKFVEILRVEPNPGRVGWPGTVVVRHEFAAQPVRRLLTAYGNANNDWTWLRNIEVRTDPNQLAMDLCGEHVRSLWAALHGTEMMMETNVTFPHHPVTVVLRRPETLQNVQSMLRQAVASSADNGWMNSLMVRVDPTAHWSWC